MFERKLNKNKCLKLKNIRYFYGYLIMQFIVVSCKLYKLIQYNFFSFTINL